MKKSTKNMIFAFALNFMFSVIELVGGVFTGSISVISDALHDFGDSFSIGIALILERKSENRADEKYTYGYARYSLLGALITSVILIVGSLIVVYNSIRRIINVTPVNYDGMIILAILGTLVNGVAAISTSRGHNLNEKSLSLHMLEDVLGWLAILVGSLVIKFTGFYIIDPILSLGITVFILVNAIKNIKEVFLIFLERAPKALDASKIKDELEALEGVKDVHHIHLWSIDGENNYVTLHALVDEASENFDFEKIKHSIRERLIERGIAHSTIELEYVMCDAPECVAENNCGHHHHHHHHHH